MASRVSNWMIGIGVVVAFAGLCFLPAALGEHGDASLLAAGESIFAFGALTIAAGIYMKAQALRSAVSNAPEARETASQSKRQRGGCELCRNEVPVIHCKVHQLHLCGACLAQHYDFRSCVYVPSTRRAENKGGKAIAAKARG